MERETDFKLLLELARNIITKGGVRNIQTADEVEETTETRSDETPKERLISYLNALDRIPLKGDRDAVRINEALAREVDEGACTGAQIVFDKYGELFEDQAIPLELLRDRLIRRDLQRLIDRLRESS